MSLAFFFWLIQALQPFPDGTPGILPSVSLSSRRQRRNCYHGATKICLLKRTGQRPQVELPTIVDCPENIGRREEGRLNRLSVWRH